MVDPTTPNMGLTLPVYDQTEGEAWASEVNSDLTIVDNHDHSSGKGVKVTPSGLNINTDLPFGGNNATSLRSTRYQNQTAVLNQVSDLNIVYGVNGNLYWNNAAGNQVQITDGAGLNFASLGQIGGDFGQPGVQAAVTYSNLESTFAFTRSSGIGAILVGSELRVANATLSSQAIGITAGASASSYTLTLPNSVAGNNGSIFVVNTDGTSSFTTTLGANLTLSGTNTLSGSFTGGTYNNPTITGTGSISANLTLSGTITGGTYASPAITGTTTIAGTATISADIAVSGAASFTGNTSGRGIIPVGTVLMLASNLAGITDVTATTAADANGFVVVSGQTISDVTSPMNGVTLPNLNDSVFIMGSSTAGTSGGSNSTTLTTTQLPAHTHTIDHGHANTFALSNATSASSTHTHNIAHVHQWGYENGSSYFTRNAADSSSTTWTTSGTGVSQFLQSITLSRTAGGVSDAPLYNQFLTQTMYTGGALSAPSGSGSSAASGAPSATSTVTLSGSVTSMTGSSGSAGTGSAYDSRPKYQTLKYIMRIK